MAFKKRWLFAMLAWILVFSLLSACAAEKATPMPTEPPVATPTPKSIPKVAPIPVGEVSLEEAEKIIGAPITPKYLPAGCKFQRGFVRYRGSPTQARLKLYFSDEEISEEVKTLQDFGSFTYKIVLNVDQIRKMPSPDIYERMAEQAEGWGCTRIDKNEVQGRLPANTVSVVAINQIQGYLSSGETYYALQWSCPGLHFDMAMGKELPVEDIIKVAESIE